MAFKPYNNHKNEKDIYANKNYSTSSKYVDNGNVKLFGFRSGKIYKMLPASIYYILAAYYLFGSIYGEFSYFKFEPMDYVLMIFKYIFYFIILFSPLLFLSDFKYVDKLPLFKKKTIGSSLIGLIIVISFSWFMTSVYKMCMSDKYYASAEAYYATLETNTKDEVTDTEETSEVLSVDDITQE